MTSEEKCFAVTGAFEGGGYANLTGNFDGMGISFGFLQWNLGKGTLQPLIKAMYQLDPALFTRCCTVRVDSPPYNGKIVNLGPDLLDVCELSSTGAVRWATQRQTSKFQLLPHWRLVFGSLGHEPKFQAVQRQKAGAYMTKARQIMKDFGFKSERALVFCFDVAVQMGSVKPPSRGRYLHMMAANSSEKAKLSTLARALGPQAGKWEQDVLSRKLCIALGTGRVHGRDYDLLRLYGVSDLEVT